MEYLYGSQVPWALYAAYRKCIIIFRFSRCDSVTGISVRPTGTLSDIPSLILLCADKHSKLSVAIMLL